MPAPNVLAACLAATAVGDGLEFTYSNLAGKTSQLHCSPQRLVMVRGDWYLIAWSPATSPTRANPGSLRTFRLARMAEIQRRRDQPPGRPAQLLALEVDALIDSGFFATADNDPANRARVVLAVAPLAWPFLRDRAWGSGQRIDEKPVGLPQGWRRLTFTTAGARECVHWILAFGGTVHVEEPKLLADDVRARAKAILAGPV